MSKFIDKLNSVSQGGLAPLGFRAAGARSKPRMLLVAHIAQDTAKPAVAGADAGLLSIPKAGAKSLKTLVKAAPDIPWGGWLKEVSRQGIKQLGEGGADFVVFPAASASQAILEEEKLGKIVEVEAALDAGLLKAVDDLPIDAVLITDDKTSLSWQDLMLFRRCANILTKPLLVTVSPDITSSELQALCEAGVAGVVVGAGKLAELRQMIDKLPSPKAGKHRKAEPLVPRIGGGVVSEEEEDEE
ncbi:hypothetical protein ES703_61090 [subsurface metagenome]